MILLWSAVISDAYLSSVASTVIRHYQTWSLHFCSPSDERKAIAPSPRDPEFKYRQIKPNAFRGMESKRAKLAPRSWVKGMALLHLLSIRVIRDLKAVWTSQRTVLARWQTDEEKDDGSRWLTSMGAKLCFTMQRAVSSGAPNSSLHTKFALYHRVQNLFPEFLVAAVCH